MKKDTIDLKNDLKIRSHDGLYDIYYKNNMLICDCFNFSYVPNKILCVKKDERIIVFSIKPVFIDGVESLEVIANTIIKSNSVKLQIFLNDYLYVIDKNCQVIYNFQERS